QKIGVLELGAQACRGGDVAETGEAEPDVDAALMVERTRSDGQSFVDGGGSTQAAPCINPALVKAEGGVVGGLVGPPDIATILSAVLGGTIGGGNGGHDARGGANRLVHVHVRERSSDGEVVPFDSDGR